MITRQFRPILTPPLRLNFRLSSSTTSSLTDDLYDRILVYRNSLRKVDTSSNQLCASLDKVCASGKLLSFSAAGTCGDCGQSTAGGVGLLAHPLNVASKVIDTSKCRIALFPRLDQRPVLRLFFLTMLYS